MIYVAFAWHDYEEGAPDGMAVYHGTNLDDAHTAVIAHQHPEWYPPTAASSYRRGDRVGATTSNATFFANGKWVEPDPDEIITVPARDGHLAWYDNGQIWRIDVFDVRMSELDLADYHAETPTWTWTEWAPLLLRLPDDG